MTRDLLLSWVRTVVPVIVGILISHNILPESLSEDAIAAGTLLITSAYYVGLRWLESRYSWVGWLLGAPKAPSYE